VDTLDSGSSRKPVESTLAGFTSSLPTFATSTTQKTPSTSSKLASTAHAHTRRTAIENQVPSLRNGNREDAARRQQIEAAISRQSTGAFVSSHWLMGSPNWGPSWLERRASRHLPPSVRGDQQPDAFRLAKTVL